MVATTRLLGILCLLSAVEAKLTQGQPKDDNDRIRMLFDQFDILTLDGKITQDEIVASVKSLMNTRIADPLDTEGSALLMKVRGDLAAKYDGNQDGVIERAEALAAWAKYSAGGGKDEL